jgi:hypothetical protein
MEGGIRSSETSAPIQTYRSIHVVITPQNYNAVITLYIPSPLYGLTEVHRRFDPEHGGGIRSSETCAPIQTYRNIHVVITPKKL